MMFEVPILIQPEPPSYLVIPRWQITLPRGLEWGTMKSYKLVPTDDLCEWLTTYTVSHRTIEQIVKDTIWGKGADSIGLRFGFREVRDALLFKLTWC